MIESVLFYGFSGLAISSALLVVLLPKPARALLSLIVTMFSLAVLFILLQAYFVAMAHLIVYAGAILVLFLFVIMLQGVGATDIPLFSRFSKLHFIGTGIIGLALLGILAFIFIQMPLEPGAQAAGTVDVIGMTLFQDYLLPFELTSILLLLGIFAAIALAKKDKS